MSDHAPKNCLCRPSRLHNNVRGRAEDRASAHFPIDGKDFTESGRNPRKALISGVSTRRRLGRAASTVLPERSPNSCETFGFALFVKDGLPKSFDANI